MHSYLETEKASLQSHCAAPCRPRRLALLLVLLLSAAWVSAQVPQTAVAWQGRIHNTAGAPMAGAKVRLSGQHRSAQASAGENGAFRIGSLPAGTLSAHH